MEEKDMNLTNEETPVPTEEEKNPKLVKTAIIAKQSYNAPKYVRR